MASDGRGGERLSESARERVADVLKAALEPVEDAPIDDATRRLMLHLSIEPLGGTAAAPASQPERRDAATSASLLRRIFRQRGWHGRSVAKTDPD